MMKKIIGSCLFILLTACSHSQLQNNLTLIDIEANLKRMEIINLSEFTDRIKYVRLETENDLLLKRVSDLDFSPGKILITDMNICLLYNDQGKFISKIGKRGMGPGEYSIITKVNFGLDSSIYLSDADDLYEYDDKGSLIKKYNKVIWNEKYYIPSWFPLNDSLIFGHIPNSNGNSRYKALIFNKKWEITHYFKNSFSFDRKSEGWNTSENQADVQSYAGTFFYRGIYDDTLFFITDNFELRPAYKINLGKYKIPVSELKKEWMNINKYIFLDHTFQTQNYIFLDCYFGDYFPAKRLNTNNSPIKSNELYNTRSILGIYNKITRNLNFCKPSSTDNPAYTSGIYNDLDGGPRFYPRKMINDSTMIMWIDANRLKEHVLSDDFRNAASKFPDQKLKLEEFVNKLTFSDNPIIMLVTINKKSSVH